MDTVRREDLQRERTELGAAVPCSTVPSAEWDFQLGICTVVLAWENQPSALHLQSQHWQQERPCPGADTEGTGRQVLGELCVSGRQVRHTSEVIVNLAFSS